jgi:hypothetical protein
MLNRTDPADGKAMRANGHVTRRNVLTRLASASAFVVGIGGPTRPSTDPIIAAIERHRTAWHIAGDLCRTVDEVAAHRRGQKVAEADWDAFERASVNAEKALEELLSTPPESLDGIRMAITYILDFDSGCRDDLARAFLTMLLTSPILAA